MWAHHKALGQHCETGICLKSHFHFGEKCPGAVDAIDAIDAVDAIDAIALKAIERKTGARGLRSILESSLSEALT